MLNCFLLKRWLAALLLLCPTVALAAFASFQVNGSTAPVFTHVQIGGAGAIMGIASVPSANMMLIHNDQYGCYKSVGGSQWQQLLRYDNMPSGSVTYSTTDLQPIAAGCDTIVGDNLNPSNIWMGWNGQIYVSTNAGGSFALSCYTNQTPANSQVNTQQTKSLNPTIAVDPANSNIVYMSTLTSSLYVTRNQGSSCAPVSGLAAPGQMLNSHNPTNGGTIAGGYLIAFDSSGGTLTGASCPSSITPCTKNIYVSVYGTGVYKSIDAGASWTLTSGTPTTHRTMKVGAGVLWMVDDSYTGGGAGGSAKKFDGTTWTTPTFTNSAVLLGLAIDPSSCASAGACHVVYTDIGPPSTSTLTQDGGTNWIRGGAITTVSPDVPWVAAVVNNLGKQFGSAAFDNLGNVYITGEGVFKFTPPTVGGTAYNVTSQTAGIEEYETNRVVTSPNMSGKVITTGWDMGCFLLTAPYTSFPSSNTCTQTIPVFWHSYTVDWVAGSPSTLISLADNQTRGPTYASYSAISTDAGVTWTNFPVPSAYTTNGYIGGCLAASSTTNWLIAGTDGASGSVLPYYTTNAGSSWTQISVAGIGSIGWPPNSNGSGGSKYCAADRVTANTFYIFNYNTTLGGPAVIKCTASGATCTVGQVLTTGANIQFNPSLVSVPGQAGTLFLGMGPVTIGQQAGNAFLWTTNGGTSWTTISGIDNVTAVGFGAAAPGHTFPVITIAGYKSNVYGIYQSIDWDGAKTWQKIGDYPLNIPLYIWDIDGDKVVPNVFYYGTNSGVFCSAPSTAYCNGST